MILSDCRGGQSSRKADHEDYRSLSPQRRPQAHARVSWRWHQRHLWRSRQWPRGLGARAFLISIRSACAKTESIHPRCAHLGPKVETTHVTCITPKPGGGHSNGQRFHCDADHRALVRIGGIRQPDVMVTSKGLAAPPSKKGRRYAQVLHFGFHSHRSNHDGRRQRIFFNPHQPRWPAFASGPRCPVSVLKLPLLRLGLAARQPTGQAPRAAFALACSTIATSATLIGGERISLRPHALELGMW